ncbi:polysaccharide biosynthesis/export family protein [Roseiterribacter gracilis]|uniref:Uncharacterized protein n=1 Tax=Roseiterribacter gracilis TaxID=2812848 RepID=A0A8S8XAA7_9PROT|nr:hypothetical protein TMPK1_03130 [Rhodospirillales bacterium TMPK1]
MTLRDLLQIAFRFRWHATIVLAAALLGGLSLSLFMTPIYQSSSVVLVKFGREFVYRPEVGAAGGASQMVAPIIDRDEVLNEQVQILKSRDVVQGAVRAVGAERLYRSLPRDPVEREDEAIRRFERALTIVPVRNSSTIRISFEHADSDIARDALDHFVDLFRQNSIRAYAQLQTSFFEDQERSARARLQAAEQRLATFRRGHVDGGYDEQIPLRVRQSVDLDNAQKTVEAAIAEARQRTDVLKRQMEATPRIIESYREAETAHIVEEARSKLLSLRLREQELLAQFTDDSPRVAQVRREIGIAQRELTTREKEFAGRVRTGLNDTFVALERDLLRAQADVDALGERRDALAAQRQTVLTLIDDMSANQSDLRTIERDVVAGDLTLRSILTKLEEARVYDALNREKIGSLQVVQQATRPDPRKPIRPEPLLYLMAGLFGGLIGAVVLVGAAELLSDTISVPDRAAAAFGLPVLAALPYIPGDVEQRDTPTRALLRRIVQQARRRLPGLMLLGLLTALAGCSSVKQAPIGPTGFAPWTSVASSYQLGPGDEFEVKFPFNPEFNERVAVAPDGAVSLPLVGIVKAGGRTVPSLTEELETRFARDLRQPRVQVLLRNLASQRVFVGGEVNAAGLYPMPGPIGVAEALSLATGAKDTAKLSEVVLVRRNAEGRPMLRTVDVEAFLSGKGEDVPLQGFDIIYVPRSTIAEIDLFVDQYLNKAIPFSKNFSYAVNRNPGSALNTTVNP